MKNFAKQLKRAAPICIVAALTGCSDANVDLQKQILVLKEELEKAKAAQSSTPPPPVEKAVSTPGLPDAETLKKNYESAARNLRLALEEQLKDVQLESFTLYQPKFEPQPHKSEFSMEFRTLGTRFSLDHIPVRGSLEGTWVFPSVEAVVAQVEKVKAVALAEKQGSPGAPQGVQTPARPAAAEARPISSPAAANRTVAVEWDSKPGGPSTPAGQYSSQPRMIPGGDGGQQDPRRATRQQDTPQPVSPAGNPTAVMPVQREVQIKF